MRLAPVHGGVVAKAAWREPALPGIRAGDPLGCAPAATWFRQRQSETSARPSPLAPLLAALAVACAKRSTPLAVSCTSVVPAVSTGGSYCKPSEPRLSWNA